MSIRPIYWRASLEKQIASRGTIMLVTALLGLCLAILTLTTVFISTAQAAERVGPKDPAHGFPVWYEDSAGLKLELCLDGPPRCLAGLPNRGKAPFVSTKPALSNFPDEAFWWAGEASIERRAGGRALLVLAREAAFGGADEAVRRGDQVSFSRVRIRVDQLVPGASYTVTHPYGVNTFVAEDGGVRGGVINFTEDIGCALSPNPAAPGCNFGDALFGQVDPFLIWDPAVGPRPPRGFVGNPAVEHRVVGSPNGTNFFQIVGPNAGGPGINTASTNLFAIQGKIAGRAKTALTLGTRPSSVKRGNAIRLSGKLTSYGKPLARKPVLLEQKPKGAAKFSLVPRGRLTTGGKGGFILRGVKPRKTTIYRARFAAEGPVEPIQPTGLRATRSPNERVTVTR